MTHKIAITLVAALGLLLSCKEQPKTSGKESVLIKVNQANIISPAIIINDYVLITNNSGKDSLDAAAILKIKRSMPSAVDRKDSVLLNNILDKDFTYHGEDKFFTRNDFVSRRINTTNTIDTITYNNMALQFFGDVAILTYQSSAKNTTHSWTDIYLKEAGNWKIRSIHQIALK